jgi:hypothetical protein
MHLGKAIKLCSTKERPYSSKSHACYDKVLNEPANWYQCYVVKDV